jgi:hypothetical protein
MAQVIKTPSDYLRIGWTQRASARDIHGIQVSIVRDTDQVAAVCMLGAIGMWDIQVARVEGHSAVIDKRMAAVNVALDRVISMGVATWNDTICQSQDEAINTMMKAEKRASIQSEWLLRSDPLYYEVCEQCLMPIKWEFFIDDSGSYQTGSCDDSHIQYMRHNEIIERMDE